MTKNIEKSEKEETDINSFIKKISIQLYLSSKKLEEFTGENEKGAKEIKKQLDKIDKELLKRFNIKLPNSTKDSALELIKIMK